MCCSPRGWVVFCPGSPGVPDLVLPVMQLPRPSTQARRGLPGVPAGKGALLRLPCEPQGLAVAPLGCLGTRRWPRRHFGAWGWWTPPGGVSQGMGTECPEHRVQRRQRT